VTVALREPPLTMMTFYEGKSFFIPSFCYEFCGSIYAFL